MLQSQDRQANKEQCRSNQLDTRQVVEKKSVILHEV
jgi:hypothetical protein